MPSTRSLRRQVNPRRLSHRRPTPGGCPVGGYPIGGSPTGECPIGGHPIGGYPIGGSHRRMSHRRMFHRRMSHRRMSQSRVSHRRVSHWTRPQTLMVSTRDGGFFKWLNGWLIPLQRNLCLFSETGSEFSLFFFWDLGRYAGYLCITGALLKVAAATFEDCTAPAAFRQELSTTSSCCVASAPTVDRGSLLPEGSFV